MKTAISIPDPLFEEAEQLAERLGLSRSELYATAIASFVEERRAETITERLNQIYADEDSSMDEVLLRLQMLSLPREEW